jgi:glycosyltransferase involved in cell wall biosynthesis
MMSPNFFWIYAIIIERNSKSMPSEPSIKINQDQQPAQPCGPLDLSQCNVSVIIPAFNEARFIGSVVLGLKRRPVAILVVDDGSSDDTAEIAQAAGADVLQLASNQGKGAALNAGLDVVRKDVPDAVVIIDADGQHLPEELDCVLRPILEDRADIAIGSRYLENTSNTPNHRKFGHKVMNFFTSLFSGVKVTDSQSGYRAFSPRAYGLLNFNARDFSVESEMQFLASEHNLKVVDVPVTIQYLDKEKRSPWKQGATVLYGILRLTGQYRPLLYFSMPGLVSLLAGVIWGLIVIDRYRVFGRLAIGYAMICVLLCLIGLTLFSTGITLHSMRALFQEHLTSKDHGIKK